MGIYANLSYLAPRHQVKLLCRADHAPETDALEMLERRVGCKEVIPFALDRSGEWPVTSYLSDGLFRRCLMTSRDLRRVLPSLCRWAQVVNVESVDLAVTLLETLSAWDGEGRPAIVLRAHEITSRQLAQREIFYTPSPRGLRRLCPPGIRRAFHRRRVAQYRRLERRVYEGVDAVVVFTDDEAGIVHQECPGARVCHIPFGIELDGVGVPREAPRPDGGPVTLVFVGTFDWIPNLDAARILVRDILPQLSDLDLRMLIVGGNPPTELRRFDDGRRVRVMGYVPDIAAVWREADIAIVPVRFGPGVKSKTINVLAHGIPLVTSPSGREGIAGTPGVDFLEARTAAEFAHGIRRLVADPGLYRRLSENGRRLAEQHHSAAGTGSRLEDLYAELLDVRIRAATSQHDSRSAGSVGGPVA